MPRNAAKPLSPSDALRQSRMADLLGGRLGEVVTLDYHKRNGEAGTGTGVIQFINGRPGMDTGAVTIDTTETKGRPTSVNLHLIDSVNGEAV